MEPKPLSRNQKMKLLRNKYGVSDTDIGKVFDVSRERVGQLLGRVSKDPAVIERKRREKRETMALLKQGFGMDEIAKELNTSRGNVQSCINSIGRSYSDFAPARRKRRINKLAIRIREALAAGFPFNLTGIREYDPILCTRMGQIMGIKKWRRLIEGTNHEQEARSTAAG